MKTDGASPNLLKTQVFAGCLFNGLLAGGDVYRYVIEVPAWRHLSIVDWGAYSRHADLGYGLILFPVEAIAGFILSAIASVIVIKSKGAFRAVGPAVHLTTFFSALGIVFTFFAAPVMLSVATAGNDPGRLQAIFNKFHFWGGLRAIVQILAFITNSWALAKIFSHSERAQQNVHK